MMVLVLLGTQPESFNRLIYELLDLEESGYFADSHIVVQAGSTYVDDPRFVIFDFIPPEELDGFIEEADLVITHGGAGSIFSALRRGKKVIALARSGELGEHVDEHQFELVEELYKDHYVIGEATLRASLARLETFTFKKYESSQKQIVEQISTWLEL